MRISDWSSDVCSSDLKPERPDGLVAGEASRRVRQIGVLFGADIVGQHRLLGVRDVHAAHGDGDDLRPRRLQRGGVLLKALVLAGARSEEHTSELQSLMRISYAVFCLKKKKQQTA